MYCLKVKLVFEEDEKGAKPDFHEENYSLQRLIMIV